MKYLFFLIVIFNLVVFPSCCSNEGLANCSNGYSPDSNNNCLCPSGSVETYGQCLPDDNTILFGVSNGCPCKQDSFIMKILGRSTTPNAIGQYQLNLQFVDTTGITIQTGLFFIPTSAGYDSLLEAGWPLKNRNCIIDGWSYQRKLSGRVYENDSLVLHFIYTRPDPTGSGNLIVSSETCNMVVRN